MLRGYVGTDVFWEGIRDYYRLYRDRNTTTAEFRHVMERHSGRDLTWFFDQWLVRAGHPVLEGTWRYDASAKRRQTFTIAADRAPASVRLDPNTWILMEATFLPK